MSVGNGRRRSSVSTNRRMSSLSGHNRRRSTAGTRQRPSVQFRPVVEVVDHAMDVSLSSLDPSGSWEGGDAELGLGGSSSSHSTSSRSSIRVAAALPSLLGEATCDGLDDVDETDLLASTSDMDAFEGYVPCHRLRFSQLNCKTLLRALVSLEHLL